MKFTIVTPSYNQGQYRESCLRSVLDQGYPELEYFVMDGGSTDGSVKIIRRYANKPGGRRLELNVDPEQLRNMINGMC